MHSIAIGFDFDGTLIQGGPDKGVHLMYAAWVACADNGLGEILHPHDIQSDVRRMVRAYLNYPGSPRFQQLNAIVNCLANDIPTAVADAEGLGLRPELTARYEAVRKRYNEVYSALNDIAADRYWRPFASAKSTLAALAGRYDLYIASGVTEDILQHDVDRHGFDRSLFQAIWGGDPKGGADKAELIKRIKAKGYKDVLFVGDSTKDQEYALTAGAKFFRIQADASYGQLLAHLQTHLPHETQPWGYSPQQIEFYHVKTAMPLVAYAAGKPMELSAISTWIHE